ncbi:uncharacterized protein LOC126842072 [Adelges cooleyi]|uniref:uncharacterized protein LOC126842072 n=1 Tax=Adelges cooleyi TaxID=133065 RepID=UPI00217F4AB2|nr:uncharacterized protein LOC126842072 [Adelges cooleyi]
MHFKSALIVCAVYYLTSAWSIGLNSDQLQLLNKQFENYKKAKNGISEEQIAQFVYETFGMKWDDPSIIYGYDSDEYDSTNLFYLLRALAEHDNKSSDKFKGNRLTPFEVDFFLEEFVTCIGSYEQPRYLALQELSKAFQYWKTMNDALNAKLEKLKSEKGDDYVLHAGEFLLIMLEIKPVGRGLTIAQIEMFDTLYEAHKTSGSVDRVACEKVFEELGITVNDELELLFNSQRPAGILLMDLIILAAERNTAVEENELSVLSLCEVISAINEFQMLDGNTNGVLSPNEYASFVDESSPFLIESEEPVKNLKNYLKKFDGVNVINVAEYMEVVFFIDKHTEDCPYSTKF